MPESKLISEKGQVKMNNSYSFSWSIIYNLLVSLGIKDNVIEEKVVKATPSKLVFLRLMLVQMLNQQIYSVKSH